jgi:general secretion pathway protein D
VKTTLLVLLITCFGVWAQTPTTNDAASRDAILRRAVRSTLASETNSAEAPAAVTPVAASVSPAPSATNDSAAVPGTLPPPSKYPSLRKFQPRIPPLNATNVTSIATTGTNVPINPGVVVNNNSTAVVSPNPPIQVAPGIPSIPNPNVAAATPPPVVVPAAPINSPEPVIPAGEINFPGVDINQFLLFYGQLVGRTVLRPTAMPAGLITFKTETPLTKSEAIHALNEVLGMNGITMINVDEKFVKAVPQQQALQEGAKFKALDENDLPEFGEYVPRIVQLKYAKPSEVMAALQPFSKMPGGLLPIDSSQTLIIRDYSENVKRMLEIIKQVDVMVPLDYETAVIPIKYALATDIASALGSIGGGGTGTSIGHSSRSGSPMAGSGATPGGYGTGTLGQQGTGMQNNFGQPGMGQAGGMNQPGGARTTSFSDRLKQIVQKAGAAGDFQILGQNKIIPDERTNSLLIFAGKQDMDVIKDIINKLDVVLAQVLIEAIVMEVTLDDTRNLGVSYLQNSPSSPGNYFSGIGAIKNGSFASFANFAGAATNAANSLPSGFSYLANFGNDFQATITAIANDNRINVISRPRIQTSHAVTAHFQVGDTVPYVTGTYFGGINGQASSQYQQTFVGIDLQVTPLINPDGLVVMDISQDIQQLGTPTVIDNNPVPTTTKRTASAKVSVRDRDTIILGGFISTTKSKSKSGIPFLKDIPGLGYLFRSTTDSNKRTELIVLLRPTVLPTPEAAALVATQERDKLPGVRSADAENQRDEARRQKQADREQAARDKKLKKQGFDN